jgi:hypothetical protein
MAADVPTDRCLIGGHVSGQVHRWAHAQASSRTMRFGTGLRRPSR